MSQQLYQQSIATTQAYQLLLTSQFPPLSRPALPCLTRQGLGSPLMTNNDFSHLRALSPSKENNNPVASFPRQLYQLLAIAGNPHTAESMVISWNHSGTAFAIHDIKQFEDAILPVHFPDCRKYTSFTRRLNRWGFFRRLSANDWPSDVIVYHHKLFRRDQPALLSKVKSRCASQCQKAQRQAQKPEHKVMKTEKDEVQPVAGSMRSSDSCSTVYSSSTAAIKSVETKPVPVIPVTRTFDQAPSHGGLALGLPSFQEHLLEQQQRQLLSNVATLLLRNRADAANAQAVLKSVLLVDKLRKAFGHTVAR